MNRGYAYEEKTIKSAATDKEYAYISENSTPNSNKFFHRLNPEFELIDENGKLKDEVIINALGMNNNVELKL